MFVKVNDKVKVEDLIRGIIVQSGNDACIVLAEGLSGSEELFSEELTELGKEIGLKNSFFTNSTGWPDPQHLMTLDDLLTLSINGTVASPRGTPAIIKIPNSLFGTVRKIWKTGKKYHSGRISKGVANGFALINTKNKRLLTKMKN